MMESSCIKFPLPSPPIPIPNSGNNLSPARPGRKTKRIAAEARIRGFHDLYMCTGESLGRGSFGHVETYVNSLTKTQRAVKMIEKRKRRCRSKVLKEIEILHMCQSHPNILQLVEYFEEAEWFYLVFEKMSGGSLLDVLETRHYLSEKEAAEVTMSIALGLQFLHNRDIAHRDLKPENILVSGRSKGNLCPVKICDFDLASYPEQQQQHNSCGNSWSSDVSSENSFGEQLLKPIDLHSPVGSADFMAPEVVLVWQNRGSTYNSKCDIWSLGVILYVLLCGYKPFYFHERCGNRDCEWARGGTCNECQDLLFVAVLKGLYDFKPCHWGHISPVGKFLIDCMLDTDPVTRVSANDVVLHPWFKELGVSHDLTVNQSGARYYVGDQSADSTNSCSLASNQSDDGCRRTDQVCCDASSHSPYDHRSGTGHSTRKNQSTYNTDLCSNQMLVSRGVFEQSSDRHVDEISKSDGDLECDGYRQALDSTVGRGSHNNAARTDSTKLLSTSGCRKAKLKAQDYPCISTACVTTTCKLNGKNGGDQSCESIYQDCMNIHIADLWAGEGVDDLIELGRVMGEGVERPSQPRGERIQGQPFEGGESAAHGSREWRSKEQEEEEEEEEDDSLCDWWPALSREGGARSGERYNVPQRYQLEKSICEAEANWIELDQTSSGNSKGFEYAGVVIQNNKSRDSSGSSNECRVRMQELSVDVTFDESNQKERNDFQHKELDPPCMNSYPVNEIKPPISEKHETFAGKLSGESGTCYMTLSKVECTNSELHCAQGEYFFSDEINSTPSDDKYGIVAGTNHSRVSDSTNIIRDVSVCNNSNRSGVSCSQISDYLDIYYDCKCSEIRYKEPGESCSMAKTDDLCTVSLQASTFEVSTPSRLDTASALRSNPSTNPVDLVDTASVPMSILSTNPTNSVGTASSPLSNLSTNPGDSLDDGNLWKDSVQCSEFSTSETSPGSVSSESVDPDLVIICEVNDEPLKTVKQRGLLDVSSLMRKVGIFLLFKVGKAIDVDSDSENELGDDDVADRYLTVSDISFCYLVPNGSGNGDIYGIWFGGDL